MRTKIFGKQLSLFDKEHSDLFTGQEKDGKKLLPSEKNPLVRRWQTDANEKNITDKKNMLDNNVKNDYISGEKKNKQGETTMEEAKRKIQERIDAVNYQYGFGSATEEIPVFDSVNSDKVVKFMKLYQFSDSFIDQFSNGEIWGVDYDDDGQEIVAQTIWGDILKNILWQPDKNITDKKNMLDNNVKNDYISSEKKNKQGETTMEATHPPIKIVKGAMEFEVSPLNVIKPTGLSDKPDMLFEINFKNKNKKDKFLFSQVKFFKQQNSYGINLGGYNDVTQEVNEMLKLPKNRELTILIDNPTYQKMKSIYDEELDKYNKQREKGKAGAMETLREKFNKAKEIKIRYFTNSSGHGDVLLALPGEKLSADERDYLNNAEEFNEIKDFIIRNVMKDKGFQLIEKNNGDYNIDQEYIADKDWVLKRAKEYSEEKMKALKRKYQEARKTWLNEIEKGKTWLNEIEKGKIQILNKKDEIKRIQKDLDRYAKLLKLTQEEYIAMQDELDFTYIEFMDALNEQGEDSPVGYKYHQAIQKIYDKYLDKK